MDYLNFRDRSWEMWLEGTSDQKPNEEKIRIKAKKKGYDLENYHSNYDTMQGFWRFGADLVKLNST